MAYTFGAGIQLGLAPSVTYASSSDPALSSNSLTVTALVGPTINFVFEDKIEDSVFLFIGAGFSTTSSSVTDVALATTTTTSSMAISYAADLGKRFAISADLAYKPTIGVRGNLSPSGARSRSPSPRSRWL